MSAMRGILRDLVERRLWPVALLLIAAAVAVPIYLGKSSSDVSDAPLPAATNQVATASKAAVTLEEGDNEGDSGGLHNPFIQQHVRKPPAATTTKTPAATDTKTTGTTPGSTGGSGSTTGTGTGTTTKKPPADTTTSTDKLDTYHLTLRFGTAGNVKTIKDVARLTPLPSIEDPFFVYTGVLKDGETAVFLVSSDAKATGDGHCRPSTTDCASIEVKAGDTEFFDLTDANGQTTQYELDVVKLTKTKVAATTSGSTTASAAALGRHSVAGAALLRDAHINKTGQFKGLDGYRWLPELGVLQRTPSHNTTKASVNGATAASSTDVTATLPGLPVWHFDVAK